MSEQNRIWDDNDSGGFPGFCAVFGIFFALICVSEIGAATQGWDRMWYQYGQAASNENSKSRKRGARGRQAETRDADEGNKQEQAAKMHSGLRWHSADELPLIREGGQKEVLVVVTIRKPYCCSLK